jgi:hypothetical protein
MAQAEFAAICKAQFHAGGDTITKGIRNGPTLPGFCRGFGFHEHTVRNWYVLIGAPDQAAGVTPLTP